MIRTHARRFLAAALACACAVAILGGPVSAQQKTTVLQTSAQQTVRNGEHVIRVDVAVSDVDDLGAFAFVMTFDADKLKLANPPFDTGPFLGSSGRKLFCQEPVSAPGALRYACVTLGDTPAQGAVGSGRLASVYFTQRAKGTASFTLSRVEMNTPQGLNIPVKLTSTQIEVLPDGGRNWLPFVLIPVAVALFVIVVAGLVFLRFRRSGRRRLEAASVSGTSPFSDGPPS